MAVRFDASGDYLSSTTNLLNYNNNYTVMGNVYISVDTNADATIFNLFSDSNNYDYIGLDVDGTTLDTYVNVAGSFTQSTGTNLSVSGWYHIAAVRSSASLLTVYLDGVSDQTNARSVTGRTAIARYNVGYWDVSFPLQFNGRVYNLKFWDTDLTQAEIVTEMNRIQPITKLSNLNRFSPLMAGATERVKDYSGNKTNWTSNGTLTDEHPPPVSWGNSPILLPYAAAASVSVNVPVASLGMSGYAPTVTATNNQTINIPAASLTLTGQAPVVTAGGSVSINVPSASLNLSGIAPTINTTANQSIDIPTGSLGLTGYAPTPAATSNITVSVPLGSLGLNGFAPTIQTPVSLDIPVASLTLTGYAPTVQTGVTIDIPNGTLTLTGLTPTVSTTSNVNIDIPTATITLTGYIPTIGATAVTTWTVTSNNSSTWSDEASNSTTWTATIDTSTTWN